MEDIIDDQSELLEELQRLRTENRALKSSRLQASFDFRRGDRGLDGESSVLYIKSLDGRYLQVNRRFEEVVKKQAQEIIGKTDREIFENDNYKSFEASDLSVKILGEEIKYEELVFHDGELHSYITQKIPLVNADGEIYAICGISTDISEREKTLEELLESRRQHEEAQRLAQLGHWHLDIANDRLEWSPEIFKIFEIDPQKFSASYEGFLDTIHPEDRQYVNQTYQESVAEHRPYDITHRLLMQDASIKYVRECCETLYDYDNQPICSIGTVQDVTQSKLAEIALTSAYKDLELKLEHGTTNLRDMSAQISEAVQNLISTETMLRLERDFIDSLIETAPTIILMLDSNAQIVRFNSYLEALTGFSQEKVKGKDWFDTFIPELDRLELRQFFKLILNSTAGENLASHVNTILSKSGEQFQIEWHNRIIFDPKEKVRRVLAIGRDVTEQQNAQSELKRRNKILQAVSLMSQDLLKSGGWQYRGSEGLERLGKAADVSRAYMVKCQSVDTGKTACRGHMEWCSAGVKSIVDTKLKDGLDRYADGFDDWRKELASGNVKHLRKSACSIDEQQFFDLDNVFSLLMVPLFFNGKFWGFLGFDDCRYERIWSEAEIAALQTAAGVISSAMEREQSDAEKRLSMQRFQGLVESTSDWIWEVNVDAQYTYSSPTIEKILGYTADEIIGKTPFDFMTEEDAERVRKEFSAIASEWRSFHGLENINYHKDGHRVYLETNAVPVFDEAGNPVGYRGIDRDVSERKIAEGKRLELLAKQKDELVMEVHHRIKNHLQGLIGLLKQRKKSGMDHNQALNEAISQIDSIAVVYGLQAIRVGAKIHFRQMLEAILRSAEGLTDIKLSFTDMMEHGSCDVDREKAVALSLVINELLMNAIKHFQHFDESVGIAVSHKHYDEKIVLEIINPGILPDDFDYLTRNGFGSGLELATAMLPSHGAKLKIFQQDNNVIAKLIIGPPLLLGFKHS